MKLFFTVLPALLFSVMGVRAQTTAITYQGQLSSSSAPATGLYDFRFQIYNPGNSVVDGPLTNAPVGVTNGLFTVTLDFGAGVFLNGSALTLEIGVRTNGSTSAYAVLSPRQSLASVPYAIQSINASNAVALTAPLQATNLAGTIPNNLLSTNVAVLTNNVIFTAGVTATNFTGNGFGMANLPATSLIGTIPDARLSANVALQSSPGLNFAGNVAATNFSGGGHGLTNVPGAFFWVTVAGTNSQIYPNVGYIVTNNTAPVVLTLPLSPAIGDVYKVAGVGAGGWIIAQTTNQMIAAGNLSGTVGQNWKGTASVVNWSGIASSADGTKLVATANNGLIWTSTNSGATWGSHYSTAYWSSVASSSDGARLVATVGYSAFNSAPPGSTFIYTSTDYGTNWTQRASSLSWSSVASSADGTRLVAVAYGDQIYTSVNSGTNWTKQTASGLGSRNWTCVASSADGTKLVAAVNGGYIYTSANSGTNWTVQPGSGNGTVTWSALASSSDGVNLIAATSGAGQIYTSSDSGVTWTAQTVSTTASASWSSVASSSDGSRLAAVCNALAAGNIFTSANFGATWTQRNGAPTAAWSGVASSADGSQLAATASTYASNGGIYISSQSGTTSGTAGYLIGAQHSAIELIYTGNNLFLPLNHEGTIRSY